MTTPTPPLEKLAEETAHILRSSNYSAAWPRPGEMMPDAGIILTALQKVQEQTRKEEREKWERYSAHVASCKSFKRTAQLLRQEDPGCSCGLQHLLEEGTSK